VSSKGRTGRPILRGERTSDIPLRGIRMHDAEYALLASIAEKREAPIWLALEALVREEWERTNGNR